MSPNLCALKPGILTLGSIISTLSSSGYLANIIAPTMEMTALGSSPLRSCPNDALMIIEYRECKLSNSILSFFSSIANCPLGSHSRKLATVVAQINIPAARGTR